MYLETLIICINTHGIVPNIIENNICKPIMRKMTYLINMFKINAVTYGIPFISTLNNSEMICGKLKGIIDSLNLNILTPHETSLILKKQCEILNRENTEKIIKDSNNSTYFNMYANYADFMFNIVETKPYEEYVEKIYSSFVMEELDINEECDYFNTIRLLNLENVNLFEMMKNVGFNQTQITLTELIDVLYNMTQMKNLIIIDMTCSNTEVDRRTSSRIRRELIKQKLY
jgi:hypothetical protein